MNVAAVTYLPYDRHPRSSVNLSPSGSGANTYAVSVQIAMRTNTAPKNRLCASGEPVRPMNCGRKAAKNSAVLGLSRATRKPSRNALSREIVGAHGAAGDAVEPEVSARTPRNTK